MQNARRRAVKILTKQQEATQPDEMDLYCAVIDIARVKRVNCLTFIMNPALSSEV